MDFFDNVRRKPYQNYLSIRPIRAQSDESNGIGQTYREKSMGFAESGFFQCGLHDIVSDELFTWLTFLVVSYYYA